MYIGITVLIVMTIGCILKKILHPERVSGELLWLVIYNDLMSVLCFVTFWLPSPAYEFDLNKPHVGFLPGELGLLIGGPLVIIGLCLKVIFYDQNKEESTVGEEGMKQWWKGSVGNIIYIVINLFPSGMTICLFLSHLCQVRMTTIISAMPCVIIPIIVPFVPRLYKLIYIRKAMKRDEYH